MALLTAAERDALPGSDFAIASSRDYPIQNIEHARDALARSSGKPEEAQVRAAVERRYPALKKTELTADLWKADTAEQFVYGVVLHPGVEDSQGDIVGEAEIRKAAHRWLVEYRKHDIQHDGQPAAIDPVESFVAPMDMTFTDPDGGQHQVLKGSWVLGAHIRDGDAWQRVLKKELTGWSIEGTGVRVPVVE